MSCMALVPVDDADPCAAYERLKADPAVTVADIEQAMELAGDFIGAMEIDNSDQPENDEPSQDGQQGEEQQEPKSGKAKQCKKATPPKKVNQAKGSPKAKGSAGKSPRFGLGKKMNK